MIRPTLRIARFALELLEDRITPTISMSYVSGAYTGVGLGDYNETSVATGDFNGDGLADIAITVYDGVGILMNEGNGVFDSTGTVTVGNAIDIIRAGDVFGNGKQDLVLGSEWTNDIYVVPGNGDGTFGKPIIINAGSAVNDLALADLTGDGKLDVIVGTQNGVAVALNNGMGGFGVPVIYPGDAGNIAVGDFTGNGSQDIAASIQNSDQIDVYLNNGNGSFAAPTSITTPDDYQPGSITAGDFTNDGEADLAVNYQGTGAIGVMLSNGDGTFQAPSWVNTGLPADGAAMVEAADFDNDGNLDLAYLDFDGQVILPGNGQGGFGAPISINTSYGSPSGGNAFAVGDLTGDGYPDVIDAPFEVAFNMSGGDTINSFQLSAPDTATVGQPFSLTVKAEAAGNTPLYTYNGTVDWNIDGQQSGLPASSTQFQGEDMTFQVTPTAAGYLTIGVVDQNDPAATGSVTIAVSALPSMIDASTTSVETANAQDASGVPDAVTVAVKDTSGSPVSGLTNQDFAFSLLGGTSTGTFGPVAETSTPGTYAAAFTGGIAGTPDTLLVKVDGVPLKTQPKVSVTPGAADSNATTVFLASPTVASGKTDILTIVARDAAGNLVGDLKGSDFITEIAAGTSAVTFGAVSQTTGLGTYTVTLTGVTAGVPSQISVAIDGVSIAESPLVQVTPGALNSVNTQVSFTGLTAQSTIPVPVTISVADAHGNAISGLSASAFSLAISGGTSTGMFGIVSETTTPGTYTVPFTGLQAGTATTLTVKVLGVTILTKPTVIVTPGPADPRLTTVSVAAPTVAAGKTDTITIRVQDALGQPVSGLSPGEFTCALQYGTSEGIFGPVTPTPTLGVYRASFTGTTAGSTSWLAVSVEGHMLQTGPTVDVVPGAVAAATSTATLAEQSIASGNTETLTIHAIDGEGNPVVGLSARSFLVTLSGGQSTVAAGPATPTATPGTYTIPLTGMRAGSVANVSVTVAGVLLAERPTVQVTPGAVSLTASTVSVAKSTVHYDTSVAIAIRLRDAFGNAVTGVSGADFILSLQGGGSSGDFSTVIETGTPGVYSATFTGFQSGTASLLFVEVSGQYLSQKPKLTVLN